MKKTTRQTMDDLFEYLGDDRWDLAEIILDATEGATFHNQTTSRLLRELFNSMPQSDNLNMAQIACNIEAVGTDYAKDISERLIDLSDAATLLHTKKSHKVLCTRCGQNEVPAPKSIEQDPVCEECLIEVPVLEFNNDEGGCPGWNDSCGNKLEGDSDLCPDCTMGRMNAQSPRIPK